MSSRYASAAADGPGPPAVFLPVVLRGPQPGVHGVAKGRT